MDSSAPENDTLFEILKRSSKRRTEALKEEAEEQNGKWRSKRNKKIQSYLQPSDKLYTRHRLCSPMTAKEGFHPKPRVTIKRLLDARRTNMFDFCFENPLDGKFKDLPVVQELLKRYPYMVKLASTSYCLFGYDYRKRTCFLTSLTNFKPESPCPETPCLWIRNGLKHPMTVQDCRVSQKNSIPEPLVDLLVHSWKKRHVDQASAYLLIDVFSGWGSVSKRVKEKWPDVKVYSNDIISRPQNNVELDMGAKSVFQPSTLLVMALMKHFPLDFDRITKFDGGPVAWCNANRIAVLFHCSTPCVSYSLVGLKCHRVGKTLEPKSKTARDHDDMNTYIIEYFRTLVLETQTSPTA